MLLLLAVLASCTCLVLVVFLYMVMLYIVKWPCFDGYDVLFSCSRDLFSLFTILYMSTYLTCWFSALLLLIYNTYISI
jgi:hypothetical protein